MPRFDSHARFARKASSGKDNSKEKGGGKSNEKDEDKKGSGKLSF